MCIICRLKISLPISRFENSNSDLINIRLGLWGGLGFFMTLSKNQTSTIHPNDGNVLILTKFAWEKMSLVSNEISDQSWEHTAQTIRELGEDGNLNMGHRSSWCMVLPISPIEAPPHGKYKAFINLMTLSFLFYTRGWKSWLLTFNLHPCTVTEY